MMQRAQHRRAVLIAPAMAAATQSNRANGLPGPDLPTVTATNHDLAPRMFIRPTPWTAVVVDTEMHSGLQRILKLRKRQAMFYLGGGFQSGHPTTSSLLPEARYRAGNSVRLISHGPKPAGLDSRGRDTTGE